MIPFNIPPYVGTEPQYVNEAIQSHKICGDGVFTKKCSDWLEQNANANKILLTTSCTHALEMAALLCDIQPGDEVIMPSFTFVSTADAFVLRGAKIVFVDIRPDTMNIDEQLIEQAITRKTRAIVPVHYAGVSCEMDTIMQIARLHNLLVVEDAAQGVMSLYKGRTLGTIGDYGCYSFHETKNFSMGEGGAILINNSEDIEQAEIIETRPPGCCLRGYRFTDSNSQIAVIHHYRHLVFVVSGIEEVRSILHPVGDEVAVFVLILHRVADSAALSVIHALKRSFLLHSAAAGIKISVNGARIVLVHLAVAIESLHRDLVFAVGQSRQRLTHLPFCAVRRQPAVTGTINLRTGIAIGDVDGAAAIVIRHLRGVDRPSRPGFLSVVFVIKVRAGQKEGALIRSRLGGFLLHLGHKLLLRQEFPLLQVAARIETGDGHGSVIRIVGIRPQ